MHKYFLIFLMLVSCSSSQKINHTAQLDIPKIVQKPEQKKQTEHQSVNEELLEIFELLDMDNPEQYVIPYDDNHATSIHWNKLTSSAIKEAKEQNKIVMFYFHVEGCGYCELLEQTTFKDKDVVKFVNDNFVAITIDAEENMKFTKKILKKPAFPSVALIDVRGNILKIISGYRGQETFIKEISAYGK